MWNMHEEVSLCLRNIEESIRITIDFKMYLHVLQWYNIINCVRKISFCVHGGGLYSIFSPYHDKTDTFIYVLHYTFSVLFNCRCQLYFQFISRCEHFFMFYICGHAMCFHGWYFWLWWWGGGVVDPILWLVHNMFGFCEPRFPVQSHW